MTSAIHEPVAPTSSRRDLSVGLGKANLYAVFIVVPLTLVLLAGFLLPHGTRAITSGVRTIFDHSFISFVLLISGIVVHELLHALVWKLSSGRPWDAFSFGFDKRTFTPFAHCNVPMTARSYRLGALTPGLLLGLLPSLVAMVTGDGAVFLFGLLFAVAAGGDLLIVFIIRRIPATALVEDHPSRAGCYVLE